MWFVTHVKGKRVETEIIGYSVIFQTISKFVTAFVRLISGKVRVDGFNRPPQEIDKRYEFDLKIILKSLGWYRDSCSRFRLNL